MKKEPNLSLEHYPKWNPTSWLYFVSFIYSFTEQHAWLKTVHGPVVQISMADTSAPSLLNDS